MSHKGITNRIPEGYIPSAPHSGLQMQLTSLPNVGSNMSREQRSPCSCAGSSTQDKHRTPEVVGVILEGERHIGLAIAALAAQKAARGQDDVLGEGDVEAAVTLDSNRPCVIGEGDVCSTVAQVVSRRIRQQPVIRIQAQNTTVPVRSDTMQPENWKVPVHDPADVCGP